MAKVNHCNFLQKKVLNSSLFFPLKSPLISCMKTPMFVFSLKFPWISTLKTNISCFDIPLNLMLENPTNSSPWNPPESQAWKTPHLFSKILPNLKLEKKTQFFPMKSPWISWLKNPTCFYPLKSSWIYFWNIPIFPGRFHGWKFLIFFPEIPLNLMHETKTKFFPLISSESHIWEQPNFISFWNSLEFHAWEVP